MIIGGRVSMGSGQAVWAMAARVGDRSRAVDREYVVDTQETRGIEDLFRISISTKRDGIS